MDNINGKHPGLLEKKFDGLMCSYCAKSAFYKCSNCQFTYCSTICQAMDWNYHKDKCVFNNSSDYVSTVRSVSVYDDEITSSGKPLQKIVVSINNPKPFPTLNFIGNKGKNFVQSVERPKKCESVNFRLERARSYEAPSSTTKVELDTSIEKANLPLSPENNVKMENSKGRIPIQVPRPLKSSSEEKSSKNLDEKTENNEDPPLLQKIEKKEEVTADNNNFFLAEKLSDLALNPPTKVSKIERRDSKMPAMKKVSTDMQASPESSYKSHVMLARPKKWNAVFVQNFETSENDSTYLKMFVTPLEKMCELYDFLENMSNFYWECASNLTRIDPENLKVGDLVIYPFDDDYLYRAEVRSIHPKIILRMVDFGNDCEFSKEKEILPALKNEKLKKAYAFKVTVENVQDVDIENETEILIKFTSEENDTVIIKKKPVRDDSSSENSDESGADNQKHQRFISNGPILLSKIMKKDIRPGNNIKLLVLDVSNLINFEVTVCEYNDQNISHYDILDDEIATYCADRDLLGYTPITNECILVQNKDIFFRAICLSISNNRATVKYIDYGNIQTNVDVAKIIKLPAKLLYTCCAVTSKIIGIEADILKDPKAMAKRLNNKIIKAQSVEKIKDVMGHYHYNLKIDLNDFEVEI